MMQYICMRYALYVCLLYSGWGDVSTSPPAKDTFELRTEDTPLIMDETWEIRYKWRYFGRALKMSEILLDGIEEEVGLQFEPYWARLKCSE